MTARRTILILVLSLGFFLLIGTDRAWLGWSFLLVALCLSGWEAVEAGLSFLVYLIISGVGFAILWLPFGYFGQMTVADWLIEYWYLPTAWFFMGVYALFQIYRSSDETWASLKEGFDDDYDPRHASDKYPVQWGTLTFLDDSLIVTTFATEFGLLLVKSEQETIHIPWNRIESISQLGLADKWSATYLLQTESLPIRMQAPWNDEFAKWIPSSVKQVNA